MNKLDVTGGDDTLTPDQLEIVNAMRTGTPVPFILPVLDAFPSWNTAGHLDFDGRAFGLVIGAHMFVADRDKVTVWMHSAQAAMKYQWHVPLPAGTNVATAKEILRHLALVCSAISTLGWADQHKVKHTDSMLTKLGADHGELINITPILESFRKGLMAEFAANREKLTEEQRGMFDALAEREVHPGRAFDA